MNSYNLRCAYTKLLFATGVLLLMSIKTQAGDTAHKELAVIEAMLAVPESQLDLARIKLTVDRMIDPKVDIAAGLKQLDAIVDQVKAQLPANPSSRDKLEALKTYLYKAGPWNDGRPFRYNLDDPLGKDIHHKLLPNYLASRLGNCISMPALFIILGQKIGLNVTAALAPEHVFVKFRDDDGKLYNVEPTSGGSFSRDVWIRQTNEITDDAVANGLYMRPLSKRETAALMAELVIELYKQEGDEFARIVLADALLKHSPKSVFSMLSIAAAHSRMLKINFMDVYPIANQIPEEKREAFVHHQKSAWYWFAKAESLGWREPTKESIDNYLKYVEKAKKQKVAP